MVTIQFYTGFYVELSHYAAIDYLFTYAGEHGRIVAVWFGEERIWGFRWLDYLLETPYVK